MNPVYRDFSQTELDAAYNNRAVAPRLAEMKAGWDRRSLALYASAKVDRDLAYGKAPRQRLDFFHARSRGRPTFAYLHGGYWQLNNKEPNAFVAAGPLAHDINVALIEYTLAPAATMGRIVADVRAAIEWLVARLPSRYSVLASPARRARETADALDVKYRISDRLAPGAAPADILEAAGWPSQKGTVVVIGHQPDLGRLAAVLLTGAEAQWSVKKGGLWWLSNRERGGEGQVVVRAVLAPDLL